MTTSSTSFFRRSVLLPLCLLALFALAGCAGGKNVLQEDRQLDPRTYRIAVFPVENLSGTSAPLKALQASLTDKLRKEGFDVVPEEKLATFMANHRIRYVGGIDGYSADALKKETGAEAVVISALELYSPIAPPKFGFTARLVTAAEDPEILWMESVGIRGNDFAGVFEIGSIRTLPPLVDRGLNTLADSLADGFATGFAEDEPAAGRKLYPSLYYQGPMRRKEYRVAVMPFFNKSPRKFAGDIMSLHFVRELRRVPQFRVVEPGVVRHDLMQYRVIMEDGLTISNADEIYNLVGSDLLMTGKVTVYDDALSGAAPVVRFSTMMFDKKTARVVTSTESDGDGESHVHFFDIGRLSTASAVATEMVRGVVARIVGGLRPGDTKEGK